MRTTHPPVRKGRKFGRLIVIREMPTIGRRRRWLCRCLCGKSIETDDATLKRGRCRSCGCLQREHIKRLKFKHGLYASMEYGPWRAMLQRCYGRSHDQYKDYGGRGILVFSRWRCSFLAFRKDVGLRPSKWHTLERIDNERGYEPGNVRWATRKEQAGNRRNSVRLTVGDTTKILSDWATALGVSPSTIRNRLRRGWTVNRALTTKRR